MIVWLPIVGAVAGLLIGFLGPAIAERIRTGTGRHTHEQQLRVAIDELWGTMRQPEIDELSPNTRAVAQKVHDELWHRHAKDPA